MPDAVIAEHTVLLEPVVNLFCLLAVASLLKRHPATRAAATSTGPSRIADMAGLGSVPVVLGLVLLTLVLVTSAGKARQVSSPLRLWLFIGVAGAVAFSTSPSYFPHYGAFLAPAVALVASQCVATTDPHRWVQRGGVGAVGCLVAVFTFGSLQSDLRSQGQSDYKRAGALIEPGSCVFYEHASLAIAANVFSDPTDACPAWLDARGVAYTWNTDWPRSRNFYPAGFVGDPRWQAGTLSQLKAADYLLVGRSPTGTPEWAPETRSYALSHFTRVLTLQGRGHAHGELWRRTSSR